MVSKDKVSVFVRTLATRLESREDGLADLTPAEYDGLCFGVLAATDAFLNVDSTVDAGETVRSVVALLDRYDRERIEEGVYR